MKSSLSLIIVLPVIFMLLSCQRNDSKITDQQLLGVWSGLLFQTEPIFDSLVLIADTVLLYKQGIEAERIVCSQNGPRLIGRGKGGLRVDMEFDVDGLAVVGLLTHDLWVKAIPLQKKGSVWSAKLEKPEIIDTDYLVYLEFYQDAAGKLQANIQSNKENRKAHFEIEEVSIRDNQIGLEISNDKFHIEAEYQNSPEIIELIYRNPGGERKVELTKLSMHEQVGYRPAALGKTYKYEKPAFIEGIETASLTEVGIDASILSLFSHINSGQYDHIHSLLIVKENKLVLEEYFHGYQREDLKDIRSAFKSLSAMLVGKALDEGHLPDVNSSLLDFYPSYDATQAPAKRLITVRHALTMTTGIELENEDEMQWNHQDWVGYKLSLPMVATPGETYEYSSGGANLLSGVISQSTQEYLPHYLYVTLLLPMGIEDFQMLTSPYGRGYLAGNFFLRPIDFIKFGMLVLNEGEWHGEQLLSKSWIVEMTSPKVSTTYPTNSEYGYLWRILQREIQGTEYQTIEAWGNGGQFLIIIPALDMCITFTGGNYNVYPQMEKGPFDILEKYIFPSLEI